MIIGLTSGVATINLVPGVRYLSGFFWNIEADGTATVENGVSATGGLNILTFNTTQVIIDPGTYLDSWRLHGSGWTWGPAALDLIRGIQYRLDVGVMSNFFDLLDPCEILPNPLTVGTATFTFSCVIPPSNLPPEANAGGNVTLFSESQVSTILSGTATDPDGDSLTYRWLEGATVLQDWADVIGGDASLDLFLVPSFTTGAHELTLEVSDGTISSNDRMILTINNSPPHAGPSGGGIYQVCTAIQLDGQVSDYDGDFLSYRWFEVISAVEEELCSGVDLASMPGGDPVAVPSCFVPVCSLAVGVHNVVLEVDDGVNAPVRVAIIVSVIDTAAPTLIPVPSTTILWPPNHKMVGVVIAANAADNSGLPVTLSAAVASSEPPDTAGDGSTIPDFTTPMIDQNMGTISLQLRSERTGTGSGRTYTIAITATDASGNSSTADVNILAPHDRGKTK